MIQIHGKRATDARPFADPTFTPSTASSLIPLALHWPQPSWEEQVAVPTLLSLDIPWPSV